MDAELAVITAIESLGYSAFREVPQNAPRVYATCSLAGNPKRIRAGVYDPMVVVNVRAKTWKEARTAGLRIEANIEREMNALDGVAECNVAGGYRSDDPDTNEPRYQMNVDFVYQPTL